MNLLELARIRNRKTGRCSSYDVTGRNADCWHIPAHQSRVLADIRGPGLLTHLWLTQANHYRECLIRITWDNAQAPSVLCPLGDFFGLGHSRVNSYQSLLFTASANKPYTVNTGCALNCYAPMPFRKRALVELVNESDEDHLQYFYIDYESMDPAELRNTGYFHAEFRRTLPFGGWGPEIIVNTPQSNVVNRERLAWDNNYVILDTRGKGHYLGCNLSVTNFQGTWWGEGDDMIWVDGYKWPPDLHGTGSEDYLNQAWGMQPNAFLRNGSSLFEGQALLEKGISLPEQTRGYQTSYVFHLENPVRFRRSIKVTIEHGHGNHLANEMSSTAYWYAETPTAAVQPPGVSQRLPVHRKDGQWFIPPQARCSDKPVRRTPEMEAMKTLWKDQEQIRAKGCLGPQYSPFLTDWKLSRLLPAKNIAKVPLARLTDPLDWRNYRAERNPGHPQANLVNVHDLFENADGLVYAARKLLVSRDGTWTLHLGHDAPIRVFLDGKPIFTEPRRKNPATYQRSRIPIRLKRGMHELTIALDTDNGRGWGFYASFEQSVKTPKGKPIFPK